jgi:hypothetical protein
MRRLFAIAGPAWLMAVVLGGCGGSVTPPQRTTPSASATESHTGHETATPPKTHPPGTRAPGAQTLFPLTITRTGGIAGFQDRLVVAGDGLVTVSRAGQRPRRCRLTRPALTRLAASAARVPWSTLPAESREPSFPDDMVTSVQSRAGGPVALDDPRVAGGRRGLVTLLNDLTGASGSSTCRPL